MTIRMQGRSIQTRERLLEAGAEYFAEHGFRASTTARICKLAGVNGAAIHYHFGNKERLYAAAWAYAFRKMVEKYPPDGGVHPAAPPAERLRGHIHSILRRLADPEAKAFAMVQKELAEPTGLLTEVMRECLRPIREALEAIVHDLLQEGGRAVSVEMLERCVMSIKALIFEPMRRIGRDGMDTGPESALHHTVTDPQTWKNADRLADHITRFSLGGILAIRDAGLPLQP